MSQKYYVAINGKYGCEGLPSGTAKNILISNIKATVESDIPERCGIMISGIPGGGTEEDVK